jgi:hypothetical protein
MKTKVNPAKVSRIREASGQAATVLEHDSMRAVIEDRGGVIPELSALSGRGWINAHWLPWFRNKKDYLAGNFPCIPNFGAAGAVDGIQMPSHGWTSAREWQVKTVGIDEESGGAWVLSVMQSPEKGMPLGFEKIDLLLPGQTVHYSSLKIQNSGNHDISICAGYHNTLGAPFLQAGCIISASADSWATAPKGGEFDNTARLAPGAVFQSLEKAPLAGGEKTDISLVPGPAGYTDFVTGVIPGSARLGWSSVVNPLLKLAYICFFTGPAESALEDIVLRFNDLWMQYGGRNYIPWAAYEGGTDLTYCLGTENVIAAYAEGLAYSRQAGKVLGTPVTAVIPAGSGRVLRYGTLFAPFNDYCISRGIENIEREQPALIVSGGGGKFQRFTADPFFTVLKKLEKRYLVLLQPEKR